MIKRVIDMPLLWLCLILIAIVLVMAFDIRSLRADLREHDKPSYQEYLAREYVQVGGELQRMRWARVCK